jgi:hypothetical protein
MIGWIIQVTALSLCLIAVMHYLYVFFKTTLTVPKVKDLVNRPQKQYDALFKGVTLTSQNRAAGPNSSGETTSISMLLPMQSQIQNTSSNTNSMKDELKQFLKNLNRKDSSGSGRGL